MLVLPSDFDFAGGGGLSFLVAQGGSWWEPGKGQKVGPRIRVNCSGKMPCLCELWSLLLRVKWEKQS